MFALWNEIKISNTKINRHAFNASVPLSGSTQAPSICCSGTRPFSAKKCGTMSSLRQRSGVTRRLKDSGGRKGGGQTKTSRFNQCWAKLLNKPLKQAEIKIESRFCLGLADLRQSYFSQFWFKVNKSNLIYLYFFSKLSLLNSPLNKPKSRKVEKFQPK